MSLLSILLDIERSRGLRNQHFALAMRPEDILTMHPPTREFYNPLKQLANVLYNAETKTLKANKSKFQINLDVQHFCPDEISVKTADGYIIIEACHEEKRDEHGWVSRKFIRRYPLPEGCNLDAVESELSSDGVLTVTAPLKCPQVAGERTVPIILSGPVKTQSEDCKAEGDSADTPVENSQ
ncbi:hypothetical protein K1T71_001603 [Dendrolimus kikuchii]|uniref:Uncharacterized protein n=1 Tax=Dendrolimus kikuchii TaxID=765133 RepID=A0ACC1DE61_9NEOP|nr:hypothetical protein K1T71_001603 [Dendrolimus kikuchii]